MSCLSLNKGLALTRWQHHGRPGGKVRHHACPDFRPALASGFCIQWNLDIALARHFGAIGDAGIDISLFKAGILL